MQTPAVFRQQPVAVILPCVSFYASSAARLPMLLFKARPRISRSMASVIIGVNNLQQ